MEFDYKNTHERRPSPVKFIASIDHDKTASPRTIGEEMFQERYVLSLTVKAEFWSNQAQFETKIKHAKRMAKSHMFKDMLPLVEEILMNAETEECIRAASRLREMMIGMRDWTDGTEE